MINDLSSIGSNLADKHGITDMITSSGAAISDLNAFYNELKNDYGESCTTIKIDILGGIIYDDSQRI